MMASPEWLAMNRDAETLFDLGFNAAGMNASRAISTATAANTARNP